MKYLLLCLAVLMNSGAVFGQRRSTRPSSAAALPPYTQKGANTFGCLVNGKAWVPRGKGDTPGIEASVNGGFMGLQLELSASRCLGAEKGCQNITFDNLDLRHIGVYTCKPTGNGTDKTIKIYYTGYPASPCNEFDKSRDTTAVFTGQVNIKHLDYEKGIVAGTFQLTFTKPGCPAIRITEGRFDTMFKQY